VKNHGAQSRRERDDDQAAEDSRKPLFAPVRIAAHRPG
jgi:hypothetical protein